MKTSSLSNTQNNNFASNKPTWRPNHNPHWNNSYRSKRRYFNADSQQKRQAKYRQMPSNPSSRWGSGKKLRLDEMSTDGSRKSSEDFSKHKNQKDMSSVLSSNSSDNSPQKM
jgi:hypothetical protein